MVKKLLCCFLPAMLALGFECVSAKNEAFDITYDMDAKRIEYSGCTTVSNELISITILPDGGVSASEVAASNSIIKSERTAIGGDFGGTIEISDKLKSNSYVLKITASESGYRKTYPFSYISATEASEVLTRMNEAREKGDYDTFSGIVTTNCTVLGLSETKILQDEIFIKLLWGYLPDGGYNINNFYTVGRFVTAIADIRGLDDDDTAGLDELIEGYAAELGADIDEYNGLSDEVKRNFIKRMKNVTAEYMTGQTDVKSIYFETMLFARLDSADNYVKLREIVLEYAAAISLDLTKYNSSGVSDSGRNAVFQAIYDSGAGSIEELKSLFAQQVDKYYITDTGSGGGGSGSSSGFVSASVGIDNTDNGAAETVENYIDMENHWAREFVTALSEKGIVAGYTDNTFLPENNITRAEFTRLICECFGIEPSERAVFDDVVSGKWYFGYVSAAYGAGIINGFDGKFLPDEAIRREDAAVIVYNAMKYSGKDVYLAAPSYEDVDMISDYALGAVGYLQVKSIMTGDGGFFDAHGKTTRAQAATLIYKILKAEGKI